MSIVPESGDLDCGMLERRLTELEIKSALADDALDLLSQTIFRQQEQLEALAKELVRLRDLVSRGRKSACRWYGDMLLRGNMPGSDLYYGMELIKEACEWGDPFAMVDVGEYVRESCRRVVVKWG